MTLFRNRQVPSLACAPPVRLLRSLPPSFAPPVCMHPPHLRSPSFPHRQGVPKVSWPHHFRDPHTLMPPFAQVAPLAWPPRLRPPFAPPRLRPLPPLRANGCAGGTVRPPSPFRPGHPPLRRSPHSRGRPLCAPLITRPPRFRALS